MIPALLNRRGRLPISRAVRYVPRLERMEDRSQPGTLLFDLSGWSMLDDSIGILANNSRERVACSSQAMVRNGESRIRSEMMEVAAPANRGTPELRPAWLPLCLISSSRGSHALWAAVAAGRPADGMAQGEIGITKVDGTWTRLADMPTPRQEVATAVLGFEVFVLGGLNAQGQPLTTVEAYNPFANTWRPIAPLPIANDHLGAAVANHVLYAFGGRSNRVFAYWPEQNRWIERTPMRYQHGGTPAVAVIDEKIYVAGGTGPGMLQNEVEVYDPVANTWTTLPPMGVPRNHTAGGNMLGLFVVAAGRGSANAATAFEAFDPRTQRWFRMPDLPTGRSGVAGAVVQGCFYVFGGEIPRIFPEVEVFDPYAFGWRAITPMPTPRHGIFAAVIENFVFLPGGGLVQGLGPTSINEVFAVGL